MPSTKQPSRLVSRAKPTHPVPDSTLAEAAAVDDGDDADGDLLVFAGTAGASTPNSALCLTGDAASASGVLAPRTLTVAEALSGQRLDKALAVMLPEFSRSRLQAWIESGAVKLNGSPARVRQVVVGGDTLHVTPETSAETGAFLPEPMMLDLIHEDESLAVINKPAGMVVHPAAGNWSGTLMNGLLHRYENAAGLPRAGIVHRLDKLTSGLMVVARTLPAQTDLVRQLQARTVKRTYLAVVWGVPPLAGTVDKPIGRDPSDRLRMAVCSSGTGREARTHFRRLAVGHVGDVGKAPVSLIACQLETGRTHQIRVHMEALGHPLLGDPVYRRSGRGVARVPVGFSRQALHAARLGLEHPLRRESVEWTVPLPDDMRALMIDLELPADVDLE